jgi:hypothetical protein
MSNGAGGLQSSMNFPEAFPILFERRWSARGLDAQISEIDTAALVEEYKALRNSTPRRGIPVSGIFPGDLAFHQQLERPTVARSTIQLH